MCVRCDNNVMKIMSTSSHDESTSIVSYRIYRIKFGTKIMVAHDTAIQWLLLLIKMCILFFYSSQKNFGEVSNRPVNASTPVLVINKVCSNWADRFPSDVAAVHLS